MQVVRERGWIVIPKFNMSRNGFLASAIISSLDTKMIEECIQFASRYSQIRTKIALSSDLHNKVIEKLTDILRGE